MSDTLGGLAVILLAISFATERMIVILKTLNPNLASSRFRDPSAWWIRSERRRRLTVQAFAFLWAWLMAGLLAEPARATGAGFFATVEGYLVNLFTGRIRIGDTAWWVPVIALLASSASAFWNQVMEYASAVKHIKTAERKDVEAPSSDIPMLTSSEDAGTLVVGRQPTAVDETHPAALAHAYLASLHPGAAMFVPDPDVQVTTAGVRIVHFSQEHLGIPVHGRALSVWLDPDQGQPLKVQGKLVKMDPATPARPQLTASAAVLAAGQLVLEADDNAPLSRSVEPPRIVARFPPPAQGTLLELDPFESPLTARLVYKVDDHGAQLAWEIHLVAPDPLGEHEVLVAAAGPRVGKVLASRRTVAHAVKGLVFEFHPGECNQPVERDFPLPETGYPGRVDTPLPRSFGNWLDGDETAGNNAVSYRGNTRNTLKGRVEESDVIFRPGDADGADQRMLNAFYFCNILHDFFLFFGFDEEHGNFQYRNPSNLGKARDRLEIRVFDDSFEGIAKMSSRPDGRSPTLKLGFFRGRHSALDAEVVVHEFVHGVTNRLVGGNQHHEPLRGKEQSEAMAEGYSDFYALTIVNFLRRRVSRAESLVYGAWLGQDPHTGLRNFSYDDSFRGTYGDLGQDLFREAHDAGQVWCRTLLDVADVLRTALGRDEGDVLAWRIVTDSLKLMTPDSNAPTFLDGRNAIRAALDHLASRNAVRGDPTLIRTRVDEAFRKRGMGPDARSRRADYDSIRASNA